MLVVLNINKLTDDEDAVGFHLFWWSFIASLSRFKR